MTRTNILPPISTIPPLDLKAGNIEAAKTDKLGSKIDEVMSKQIKIDPTVLKQFPEIAPCVKAYLEYFFAERKEAEVSALVNALIEGLAFRIKAASVKMGIDKDVKKNIGILQKDLNAIKADITTLIGENYNQEQVQVFKVSINLAKYSPLSELLGDEKADLLWLGPAEDANYPLIGQKMFQLKAIYDRTFNTPYTWIQSQNVDQDSDWKMPDSGTYIKIPKCLITLRVKQTIPAGTYLYLRMAEPSKCRRYTLRTVLSTALKVEKVCIAVGRTLTGT